MAPGLMLRGKGRLLLQTGWEPVSTAHSAPRHLQGREVGPWLTGSEGWRGWL